jgi:hypothetical protein
VVKYYSLGFICWENYHLLLHFGLLEFYARKKEKGKIVFAILFQRKEVRKTAEFQMMTAAGYLTL